MIKRGVVCVVMCAMVWVSKASGEKDEWKLGEDKDGIKIYTRKSEQGKIRTSKAVMYMSVPPSTIMSLLQDFNSYSKWFPNCIQAKILKQVGSNEFISQLIYKTPWPIPNFDCVERMVIDRKPVGDTTYIRVNAEPDYIKQNGGNIRVRQMQDTWQVVAVKGGTLLINVYYTDMGGVPYWIANTQTVEIPYSIFRNMRDYILTGKAKK